MDTASLSLLIFIVTYLGIALGSLPGLAIDRTGVALLGAIAMVVAGVLTTTEAVQAIDVPTLLLLYGLMVLSSQFRLGGFYTRVALKVVKFMDHPRKFLLVLMLVSALFSSILANDIVCLAFTPVLAVSLVRASLNPIPFLVALACASNIGSAATLIGNPQNMLIGQMGKLDFGKFLWWCGPPSLLSLIAAYGIICFLYQDRWNMESPPEETPLEEWPEYNSHQSTKGIALTVLLMWLFFTSVPREFTALAVAGVLLCSRKIATRSLLGLVDWHLMTLFCALFIVIQGVVKFGLPQKALLWAGTWGMDLSDPLHLSTVSLFLSNIVSNVPAVLLLLKGIDLSSAENLYVLALTSTFAGNLLTIGSIANLITIEEAKRCGVSISFGEHARIGVPVTAASFLIILGWVYGIR